jgi:hypothetical protein
MLVHLQAKLNSRRITNSLKGAAVAVCASVDSYASKWHCSAEIMKSTYLNAAFAAHVERYVHMLLLILTCRMLKLLIVCRGRYMLEACCVL